MSRLLVSTIALTLLGTAAAQAQSTGVRYNDLDLSSQAGQAELDRRIDAAARRVCVNEPQTGTRIANPEWFNRCKAEVRAQVEAGIKA